MIEGIDGAGKTHLARAVRDLVTDDHALAVELKDERTGAGWADRRLATMHDLVWSYDHHEPVWEYGQEYWVHELCAWFRLYYQARILPHLEKGLSVITDGWYLKHQARIRANGDPELARWADERFGELPTPDLIVLVDPGVNQAHQRKEAQSKPSERGAFRRFNEMGYLTYQGDVRRTLLELLTSRDQLVLKSDVHPTDALDAVVVAISGRRREST